MLKRLLGSSFLWVALVGGTSAVVTKAAPAAASESPATSVSISPGVTFLGGIFGPSINSYIGFAPLHSYPFFVGMDLSLDLFFPSGFLMNIGLLPSVWYQFRLPDAHKIHLVSGLSFGPAIVVGSASGATAHGVTYEFLFRPGALFEVSNGSLIGFDLKFGVLGGAFIFKPQMNFIVSL